MPRKKATPVVPAVASAAEVNTVEVSVIAETKSPATLPAKPPSKRGRKPKTTVAPVATNPASDKSVSTETHKTTSETVPDFNWEALHPDVLQQRQYSPVTLRLSLVTPGMLVKHSPLLTGIGMGSADCAGSSDDLDDGLLSEANRLKNLYWHSLLFRSQWCQSCQFQADCQGYATTEPASNSSIAAWEQALPDYWLWVPVVNQAQSFACLVCSQFRYPTSSDRAAVEPVADTPVSDETVEITSETTVEATIAALPAAEPHSLEPSTIETAEPQVTEPQVTEPAIILPGTCLQTPGKYRGYTLWTEAYVVGCAVANCTYTKQNVRCQHATIQWRSAYKPGIWVHTATTVQAAQGAVRLPLLHDTSVAAYAAAKDAIDALDDSDDRPDPPIPIPPGGWLHHYLAYRDGTGIYRSAHAKTKRK